MSIERHLLRHRILGLVLVPLAIAGFSPVVLSQTTANDSTSAPQAVDSNEGGSSDSAESKSDQETQEDEDEIKEPKFTRKSASQLKRSLTAMQYKVTQKEGTEPKFRNMYWDNKKEGIYRCIVCGLSLFSSETKYKSGTGWPSFFAPIKKDHVGYKKDFYLFYPRVEVHCQRCNAHLGHVFDDGPKDKTGKRYCMNSAALKFYESDKKNDFKD